jgi:DNA polymerase IV
MRTLPACETHPVATRSILHVDMDAFFVSVELLRRPELRGRPVVVGGTGARGVVAAASYEARAFGVHSAMPSVRARRLCPDLVFLPGDHAHYGDVSRRIMAIFSSVTPLVEPLSLDEAFLDVTGTRRLHGPAPALAGRIRDEVAEREGLTCSVGVAPNKFLAKLASEAAKPRAASGGPTAGAGVVVVEPGAELAFLHPLPVTALWGVGPATLAKLERFGVRTVGDLAALPPEALTGALGQASGLHLHELSWARDDRPVVPDQEPRSISHEETFASDRHRVEDLRGDLVRMADAVAARLRRHGYRGRTVQLKVRYGDFTTVTRSHTLAVATDRGTELVDRAWEMLEALPVERGVRLLGVGVANLTREAPVVQLSLDDGGGAADGWDAANDAVDAIRSRFGAGVIGPGRLVGSPDRPGSKPWGPDADEGENPPG